MRSNIEQKHLAYFKIETGKHLFGLHFSSIEWNCCFLIYMKWLTSQNLSDIYLLAKWKTENLSFLT